MSEVSELQKGMASAWFMSLRDDIVAEFERLEDTHSSGPFSDCAKGEFEVSKTKRHAEDDQDAGGGLMSVLRGGRVFEKVGVNVSTVHGELGEQAQNAMAARKSIAGMKEDPRFWASGISLVAHMQNPHCPAVHMNTRMFWTPHAWWFGGGTDLNPMVDNVVDTAFFHNELKKACDIHNKDYYPKFKNWADDYFMIKHWNEPRGVGGIFYDDLCTHNWESDFAFTRDVGLSLLNAFVPITRKHSNEDWSEEEREWQLVKRGRYTEFNLVYDRGTQFGLQTGHNPEAVLMSLPPIAKWP
jgi:coproporphyrinogen III oxidase